MTTYLVATESGHPDVLVTADGEQEALETALELDELSESVSVLRDTPVGFDSDAA